MVVVCKTVFSCIFWNTFILQHKTHELPIRFQVAVFRKTYRGKLKRFDNPNMCLKTSAKPPYSVFYGFFSLKIFVQILLQFVNCIFSPASFYEYTKTIINFASVANAIIQTISHARKKIIKSFHGSIIENIDYSLDATKSKCVFVMEIVYLLIMEFSVSMIE